MLAYLNAHNLDIGHFPMSATTLSGLKLGLVRSGDTVSHTAAKTVFAEMARSEEDAGRVAQRLAVTQVGDESALERWIDEVFSRESSGGAAAIWPGSASCKVRSWAAS